MKTLFIVMALCLVCSVSFAERVYYQVDTKEVLFTSSGAEVVVINDANISFVDIKSLGEIEGLISDYKVSGNRLVINNKKVSDRNAKIEDALAKEEAKRLKRISAETKLKALGLTDDEVKLLTEKE